MTYFQTSDEEKAFLDLMERGAPHSVSASQIASAVWFAARDYFSRDNETAQEGPEPRVDENQQRQDQLRQYALHQANQEMGVPAESVVRDAEKFLAFLQGERS